MTTRAEIVEAERRRGRAVARTAVYLQMMRDVCSHDDDDQLVTHAEEVVRMVTEALGTPTQPEPEGSTDAGT